MSDVYVFLRESNAIEGVYDQDSLKQAQNALDYIMQFGQLSKSAILQTHRILMFGKLTEADLGRYRTINRWMLEGKKEGTDFNNIDPLMDAWISTVNRLPRLEDQIRQDHIIFEKIHPFADGNGRVGRILLNWERVHSNLPILVIKESEKSSYYSWFKPW